MSLSSIIAISISLASPIVSRAGFSTPLFLSGEASTIFDVGERVREYTNPDDLIVDTFDAAGATYKAAALWFSQVPNSGRFKVGSRLTSAGFNVGGTFTLGNGSEGEIYSITIDGVEYTDTLGALEDEDDGATAVAALIDALADYTATAVGPVITFAVVADHVVPSISFSKNIEFADTTATSGTTTVDDIVEIRTNHDTDWYALGTDVQSAADIQKVRAWAETQRIMYFATTSDGDTFADDYDPGVTTDVGSAGKDGSYVNTFLVFSDTFGDQAAFGWASMGLVSEPGTINWAHNTIRGLAASNKLNDVQKNNLISKGINWYTTFAGAASTFNGITGGGEFVDTINLVHFLYARIPEDLIAKLRAVKRVPFTQTGLDSIAAVVASRLASKVGTGLSNELAPFCNAPRITAITPDDRQARRALGFKFGGVLDGAINTVGLEGTLSVDPTVFEA